VALAKESCARTLQPDARQLDALAAAYAESGDYDAAAETASRARDEASATDDEPTSRQIGERLELYRQHRPYRQPAPRN
jgi:hypothetical protein